MCCSTAEDAVAYRRRVVRRAESTWFARFSRGDQAASWDSIRSQRSELAIAVGGGRGVGRGGGERGPARRRWLPRRTCPGGSAKRQDLLQQSCGARCRHGPSSCPRIGVREAVSDL